MLVESKDSLTCIHCSTGRNVEDNEFTGWVPDSLEGIDNLE
jgi:hypothetical protein